MNAVPDHYFVKVNVVVNIDDLKRVGRINEIDKCPPRDKIDR